MEKPIATLKSDFRENSPVIYKALTQEAANGNFEELINYLLDPRADDINPGYNGPEREYAQRIRSWRDEVERNPNGASFNLFAIDERGEQVGPFELEDKVSDYLPRIVRDRTIMGEDGPQEYKSADLFFIHQPVGGVLPSLF